jgi:hypothetical protein
MGAIVGGSMEVMAVFPLRLSLAPLLPLRLTEAKDKVPCFKPAELDERCALVDLCGAMMVVVVIGLVKWMVEVVLRDTNLM